MSDITIKISRDSQGFTSQQCPACNKYFIVVFVEEKEGKPLKYCPCCGHVNEEGWRTKEQLEYIKSNMAHKLIYPELEDMTRKLNNQSKRSSFIKITSDFKKPPKVKMPEEVDRNWPTIEFDCCNESIKYEGEHKELFCVICGSKKAIGG